MSQMMVIAKFFGMTAREAKDEVSKLTPEGKAELAELAAAELGVELK